MMARVAKVLGRKADDVWGRTRLCGTKGAPRPPVCWSGSPYQSIPVAEDVDTRLRLQVLEHQEDYPGVTAELAAVRDYPGGGVGANAAHMLGYVGPVSDSDLAGERGQDAAEDRHHRARRPRAPVRRGPARQARGDEAGGGPPGRRDGHGVRDEPVPGNHLVTSIDARIQAVAEKQLLAAITRARTVGDRNKGGKRYKADSGAVVVMDVRTGHVVAMASYPTYDPSVWVGGITAKEYASHLGVRNNYPNQSRATQGEFAPGSTFKPVTLPAAVMAGYPLGGTYPCPSSYTVGGRSFSNYESEAFGQISLKKAIEVSCDTVFYKFAYEMWVRDGGIRPSPSRRPPHPHGAGLRARQGDRPRPAEESGGRIADRSGSRSSGSAPGWSTARRAQRLPRHREEGPGARGVPQAAGPGELPRGQPVPRRRRRQLLHRPGRHDDDAAADGPLYAAIANGGTLWVPTIAKAVVEPGRPARPRDQAAVRGRLPVRPEIIRSCRTRCAASRRTAPPVPLRRVAARQDSDGRQDRHAEVYGKQSTSWFATYGPATAPQYSVVMMVSQGGTGSGVSGPSVEKIYEALLGVKNRKVVPSAACSRRRPRPSRDQADGTIVVPKDSAPAAPVPPKGVAAATTPSASTTRSAAGRKPG
jgi:penicillin-binding protein 2